MRDQVIAVSSTVARIASDLDYHFIMLPSSIPKSCWAMSTRPGCTSPTLRFWPKHRRGEDSDNIILLWRPSLYMGETIPMTTTLYCLVEKQRGAIR
jgi:hypothetical protein